MALFKPPGYCPNCGDFVEAGRQSCPSCGSCDRAGWSEEESLYDGLDLPEDEAAVRESGKPGAFPWVTVVACLLLVLFISLWALR